jgi:hypothetical protein
MKTWRLLHLALNVENQQNIAAYNVLFVFAIAVQYLKPTKKLRGGKPGVLLVTVSIAATTASQNQKIVVLLQLHQHAMLALLLLMKR